MPASIPMRRMNTMLKQRIRHYGIASMNISGEEVTISVEGDGNG
jgi:hypothetical protein